MEDLKLFFNLTAENSLKNKTAWAGTAKMSGNNADDILDRCPYCKADIYYEEKEGFQFFKVKYSVNESKDIIRSYSTSGDYLEVWQDHSPAPPTYLIDRSCGNGFGFSALPEIKKGVFKADLP